MKKAIFITRNLVQDHEFIYPYYRLKEEGFEITVALPDGERCVGILGTKIPPDDGCRIIDYDKIETEDYDLLVIPGGAKAMEYLRQDKVILDFISNFNKSGKVIASICHGAQLLISAKAVKGREISGYYSIRDDIDNAGAIYVDAPFVTDKNIVTSPHYKHMGDWMKETLRLCK